MEKSYDILVNCKHCGNEIGLFDEKYITSNFKYYCKCNNCGNSERERKINVVSYNKMVKQAGKLQFELKQWLGVHEGFSYIKQEQK